MIRDIRPTVIDLRCSSVSPTGLESLQDLPSVEYLHAPRLTPREARRVYEATGILYISTNEGEEGVFEGKDDPDRFYFFRGEKQEVED